MTTSSLVSKPTVHHFTGLQPYLPLWRAMQEFTHKRTPLTPDELWFVQHESVFTLGRNADKSHILQHNNIPIVAIDRGGEVTFHGPGQATVYTMLNIKRLRLGAKALVETLEGTLLSTLTHFDISGELLKGSPGIYVEGKKIGAVGLRIKNGYVYHGLSLNIDMDLTPFSYINPCGHIGMASIDMRRLNPCADITSVRPVLEQTLLESLYAT